MQVVGDEKYGHDEAAQGSKWRDVRRFLGATLLGGLVLEGYINFVVLGFAINEFTLARAAGAAVMFPIIAEIILAPWIGLQRLPTRKPYLVAAIVLGLLVLGQWVDATGVVR